MLEPSISKRAPDEPLSAGAIRQAGLGLAERLGWFSKAVADLSGKAPIWIHAASVGEVLASQPLIALLREKQPDRPLMMTTTTVAGRATASDQLGLPATLLPLDLPWVVGRALDAIRPAGLVIVETELWPGLLRAAARRGVPVAFVSARISPRAASAYKWVRPLMRGALRAVRAVGAQTPEDGRRFVDLGVPAERVKVTGSLKFARLGWPPARVAPPVAYGERPVLVAASTQAGEEEIVLDACEQIWRAHPRALLVLAPRRPDRFAVVAEMVQRRGLPMTRRTACAGVVPEAAQVLVLDTLGELPALLAGAQAAFVGGTLVPLGGHNVLEPAMFGVPVFFGRHVDNVREAARALVEAQGVGEVAGAVDLGAEWCDLIARPEKGREMGRRARAEIERRAAVGQRTLELVQACLRGDG